MPMCRPAVGGADGGRDRNRGSLPPTRLMPEEPLVFIGICDWSGLVRGKAVPEADGRLRRGVGYAPTNLLLSPFGPVLATPFGTKGDLVLRPDPHTKVEVRVDDGPAERFVLGNLVTTEGQAWDLCPRTFLGRALEALARHGLRLRASFEQEFVLTGVDDRPGSSYALSAYRRQAPFGARLLGAMRAAGFSPESFHAEYGGRQYEATIAPEEALRAADGAVVLRELARALAHRAGDRASFAPMMAPDGIGNGNHLHLSLWQDHEPVTYDPARPYGLSARAESFFAGVLAHLPALCALTVPSVPSYYRLTPGRWAPHRADIAVQDRGAALRIAPIFRTSAEEPERQANVEFRVADGSCCPYLALGGIVRAGVDGLARHLRLPKEGASGRPLPRSLSAALTALARDRASRTWWAPAAQSAYLAVKRAEIRALQGVNSRAEVCNRYAAVY